MDNELSRMHAKRHSRSPQEIEQITRGVNDNVRFQKARKLRDAAAVLDSLPSTLMNSTTSRFLREAAEELIR